MNKTEALNTSLLLRWITGLTRPSDRETRTAANMLDVALALHERAYATLGAGVHRDEIRKAWPAASPAELAADNERLNELASLCICEVDAEEECPVHGAVRRLNEAQVEIEELRARIAVARKTMAATPTSAIATSACSTAAKKARTIPRRSARSLASMYEAISALPWPGPAAWTTP